MALPMQVEFLKVLACVAWADEEVTNAELNFIKQFVRRFDLSGDEWMQVELYLSERVGAEEMRQVTRRFFSRVHRSKERRMLVDAVENLLRADENLTDTEQEWLRDLQEVVSGAKKTVFFLDGLKSLLRIGGENQKGTDEGRDANLHDFIHNRVGFLIRKKFPNYTYSNWTEQLFSLTIWMTGRGERAAVPPVRIHPVVSQSASYAARSDIRSRRFTGGNPRLRSTRFSAAAVTLSGAVISMPIGLLLRLKSITNPGSALVLRKLFSPGRRGR